MQDIQVNNSKLKGIVKIPPSKSMAHRAIISASLGSGVSTIENIDITEEQYNKIKNGAIIKKEFKEDIACLKYENKIVAIYKTYEKDNLLAKPYKMFI